MIRMSLDNETVLPNEVSPAFPATGSLSEQPKLAKTRALCPNNGLHPPGNSQHTITSSAPNIQRIAKRRFSMGVGFKGLAKRRRRANSDSQSEPVLPSNFLLGGNIFDPLNLNSLLDEDVNKATNQETPKCSPLPLRGEDPVEILVPRDITDPLNLKGGGRGGKEGGGVLLSPLKARRRHRNRHHGGGGAGGEREVVPARLFPSAAGLKVPALTTVGSVPASPLPCELNTAITCRDEVAPPPILPRRHTHPLPGQAHKHGNQGDNRQRRRRRTTSTRSGDCAANTVTMAAPAKPTKFHTPLVGGAKVGRFGGLQADSSQKPQKKKDKHRYQNGNHSCYYGYNGFYGDKWEGRVGLEEDPRLRLLQADWFRDKTVLDVGCGAGHMTLAVARKFEPTHILGVELDKQLVNAAKQNVRHFLSHDLVVEQRRRGRGVSALRSEEGEVEERGKEEVEEQKKREEEQEKKMEVEEKKKREEEQEKKMEVEEKKKKREEEQENDEEEVGEEKKGEEEQEVEEQKKMEEEQENDEEEVGEEKKMVVEENKKEEQELEEVMGEFQQALSLLPLPLSFRVIRGPLSAPPLLLPPPSSSSSSSRFPNNITFIQGDYVSEREVWPGRGQYDVILCLGVTKWVQLQSGDVGVITLFKRAYQSLSPGGLFILEPQPWSSYCRSKRASSRTYSHFRALRLRPEQFTRYLTDSVGFTSYRLLTHTGNQRPVYLFHKGPAQRK